MRFQRVCSVSLVVALIVEVRLRGAEAKPKRKVNETEKQEMAKHSFTSPLTYDNQLGEWFMSAASISTRDRVLLNPGVADRHGFIFHKNPILTNDFEAIFHFKQAGAKEATLAQAFAFWYVFENVTKSFGEAAIIASTDWTKGQRSQGFILAGGKPKWNGFGCVFSVLDRKKMPKPTITGVWNAGGKQYTYLDENPDNVDAIPNAQSKYVDYRNTLNYAQLQVRVKPTSIEGNVKLSPSLSWMKVFEVKGITVPVGGYLGFTAYTGAPGGAAKPDSVSISELEVYNYDMNVIAEQSDVSKEIQDTYKEMLKDGGSYSDQKSQTDAIQRLSKMIGQHITKMKPVEDSILKSMNGLQLKMQGVEDGTKTLRKEIGLFLGNHSKKTVSGMQTELVGLRSIFMRDSLAHSNKLDTVHQSVKEAKAKHTAMTGGLGKLNTSVLDEIVQKSKGLEKSVQDSSRQSSWMMLVVILSAVIVGVLMWSRMRYYEKKHFL